MNHEQKQFDGDVAVDLEEAELEIVATTLQVRSGIQAGRGLQPCL